MPNIAEKIAELQELIQQQYGLEAKIQVYVHSHENPHINRLDTAMQLGLAIGHTFEQANVDEHFVDGYGWVSVVPPYESNTQFSLFYKHGGNDNVGNHGN